MTKVIAKGNYKVSKSNLFEYEFKNGMEYDIPDEYLDIVLETKTVELKKVNK